MLKLIIVCGIIFTIAVVMTMAGRGGGNFYVLVLVLAGLPMHQAATTGQFILFMTAFSALLIFQKNKVVSWPLAFFIGPLMALAAFLGGYVSHVFTGFILKIIFACMLVIAGFLMLKPIPEPKKDIGNKMHGYWLIRSSQGTYAVNLWVAPVLILFAGFGSGMVGVSGGSFLVPLMVLACSVPMHIAVGTASVLIGSSAFMGFLGHALRGDFDPVWAIPLATITIAGGLLGGRYTMKVKPRYLKGLFAYTTLVAAILMLINAYYTRHSI